MRNEFNFRYYAVGEYGDKFQRPHYHIILFGVSLEFESDRLIVEDCWNKGFIKVGTVTEKSIYYVSKYSTKRFFGHKAYLEFDKKGRIPEFSLMSRRPGLGKEWYMKNQPKECDRDWET